MEVAQNLYKTLTNINMVKTHEDSRVKVTLGLMESNPKLKLPQAMRAAEFTIEESKDPTLQMRVRRRQKKVPTSVTVNTHSTASPVSNLSTLTSTPLGNIKKVRHTSHAAQQKRQNKKINERKRKEAFKMATTIYEAEKKKPRGTEGKLSAVAVSELVAEQTGIEIGKRTIENAVADGRAGLSPPKQGRPSTLFSDEQFENMVNAFESFIKIQQINGMAGKVTSSKLKQLLKECTNPVVGCDCSSLLLRLLNAASIDLKSGKINNAEERRVLWTTYSNLKSWFDGQVNFSTNGQVHRERSNCASQMVRSEGSRCYEGRKKSGGME